MSIITIAAIAVAVVILSKTGSLGKAFSFLVAYLLYPIVLAAVGALLFHFMGIGAITGCIAGAIIGTILAFKHGSNKMN